MAIIDDYNIRMSELQQEIADLQQQLSEADQEGQQRYLLAQRPTDLVPLSDRSNELQRFKREIEQRRQSLEVARHRLAEVVKEREQVAEQWESLKQRKGRLLVLLGQTSGRDHDEVESQLLQTMRQLVRFDGSAESAREYQQFKQQVEAAQPFITLRHCYHWTTDRKLVREDDPKGVMTAFGRGQRIDKNEAQRLGLTQLELEAQA